MNNLEKLCRPVLLRICEIRQFSRSGAEPDMERVRASILGELAAVREKCAENSADAKDFALIEKPLIFFIDYMIKESGLGFSRSWRELARDYGELSGDEKFFDMLAETLDDPGSKDRIEVFFLMMGLGFEGVFRKEPETLERKMKVCAARMDHMPDLNKEYITFMEPPAAGAPPRKSFLKSGVFAAAVSALLALSAFGFNYYVLYENTSSFRQAVEKAVLNASPYIKSAESGYPGNEK